MKAVITIRYVATQKNYSKYTKGNEFLSNDEALGAVTTRTISFQTTNIKTRTLMDVNKESIEEELKILQTGPKIERHVEHLAS